MIARRSRPRWPTTNALRAFTGVLKTHRPRRAAPGGLAARAWPGVRVRQLPPTPALSGVASLAVTNLRAGIQPAGLNGQATVLADPVGGRAYPAHRGLDLGEPV